MFKVVVVGGPAEGYIEKCLQSILNQTVPLKACVVLDPVGDNTHELAKKYKCSQLDICLNTSQQYALPNLIKGIDLLSPEDQDIIVTIDADDWLSSSESLSVVQRYYNDISSLLVTYGSWQGYPNPLCHTNCSMYTTEDFKKGLRKVPWRGTHLRTMKYCVWKNINKNDFKDNRGNYFMTSWDMAFMLPALEMVGHSRSKFIKECIYTYNKETPTNDEKLKPYQQYIDAIKINSKSPYNFRPFF